MKRSGPYYANPPIDKKTGNPLPGLPPRVKRPNPQRGPGIVESIKRARTYASRVEILDIAKSFDHIAPRTLRRVKQAVNT